MRGFVLAAGFGTRLRPITDHVPKALVNVCGRPLLERSLAFLGKNGIKTIGVNTHYLSEQLFAHQRVSKMPFELFHEKDAIRGTGGAFHFARAFLSGDDLFFVCNVDIVYDFDLAPLVEQFKKSGFSCGLLATRPATGGGTGSMYYRPDDSCYAGVPAWGAPPPGAVGADYIGAALYTKEFLDVVGPGDFSIVPVWKRAMESGLKAGVFIVDPCYWRDIGTPASLAQAHFDRLEGALSLETPEELTVDVPGRRCMHRRLAGSLQGNIGSFAWVETETVPAGCRIVNSVVYKDAAFPRAAIIDHAILTPFGEVSFG